MLIDTHAHLTHTDRYCYKQIIADMKNDNLSHIITVGYNMQNSIQGLEIASNNQSISCSVGFHPSYATQFTDDSLLKLKQLSKNEKVKAIGEIGLDYHYPDTNKAAQKNAFIKQLRLSKKLNLPCIIHMRDSSEDTLAILKQEKPIGGVMHCYSGSVEMVEDFLCLGLYISFSGTITFSNNKKAEDIAKSVPKNRILIETDCPYLAPQPHRGKTNYPKFVSLVAQRLAEILHLSFEEVASITAQNAKELFKLDIR